MKNAILIILTILMTVSTGCESPADIAENGDVSIVQKANYSKEDFLSIKKGDEFEAVIEKFGDDYTDVGSGFIIIAYPLDDGSSVQIRFNPTIVDRLFIHSSDGTSKAFHEWDELNP